MKLVKFEEDDELTLKVIESMINLVDVRVQDLQRDVNRLFVINLLMGFMVIMWCLK